MLKRFEDWTKRAYKPRIAKWKRPTLFALSLAIGIACLFASYFQVKHQWTNDSIWLLIGIFGFLSSIGLIVSIFCKDYWVALVLGKPSL